MKGRRRLEAEIADWHRLAQAIGLILDNLSIDHC